LNSRLKRKMKMKMRELVKANESKMIIVLNGKKKTP